MLKTVKREPQPFTVDEYFADDNGLPEKMELWDGMIGPYRDAGILSLLANWGADKVIEVTGPKIWREALAAYDGAAGVKPPEVN